MRENEGKGSRITKGKYMERGRKGRKGKEEREREEKQCAGKSGQKKWRK